jgi:DNA polymerase-3 subunit delta'
MNWGIIGHEWAIDLLKDQALHNSSRHAYLITGPQGVGRRTLAVRLAQALNCLHPTYPGVPCRQCRTCEQIDRLQHPDISVIQSEMDGKTIKVDQIRKLQHELSLYPYEASYRVAILLRFEEASVSAANALLKTLEEPPLQVVIVLTAESGERLLPTIVSRCEVLRLRPIASAQISQNLQNTWAIPEEDAILLAHISGGRPGYALKLHHEPEMLTQRNNWISDLYRILKANRVERFTYAASIAKDKDKLHEMLYIWLSVWRDILLVATQAPVDLTNIDQKEEIKQLATNIHINQIHQIVCKFEQILDRLDHNVNTRMATEVLLLDLPMI